MADNILFYAISGVAFGCILFFKGFKWYMLKKTVEDTPTSKIRSLAMGFVEVFGKVVPYKILISPFSGAKCVYFRYWIDEWRKTGKNSYGWVTVKQGSEDNLFYIKDDTGKVLINPKGAEIDIPIDFTRESGMGNDPSGLMKKFLKSQGVGFEGLFGIN
ncbi:MAG: GIDE domain-containing protein, partial [Nanoarchaeota archaeon]